MKKKLIILTTFLIILYSNCLAQVNYKEGYFINNVDKKISCSIKNLDWKNNPTEFYYKLSKNSEFVKTSIEHVKEFEIINWVKYKRFVVDIDRSSDLTKSVSIHKQPIFSKERLFLKVLVEGNATLYSYEGKNLKRYFFSLKERSIEQLVYKKYVVPQNEPVMNNYIGKNNYYKQQLSNNLKCPTISENRFKSIKYQQKELINLFNEYNNCGNEDYVSVTEKKVDNFNLSIRPGINISTLTLDNTFYSSFQPIKFGNKATIKIGLEVEYILPFNKNKWAIIIEPSYNSYSSESSDYYKDGIADIKSIDIPIGIRHYFFLNKDSKLFINTSFLTGFGINSKIDFEYGFDLDASGIRNNMVFGAGYKYKKYSIELNYDTKNDVLNNYVYWFSNYQRASLIVGYNIF